MLFFQRNFWKILWLQWLWLISQHFLLQNYEEHKQGLLIPMMAVPHYNTLFFRPGLLFADAQVITEIPYEVLKPRTSQDRMAKDNEHLLSSYNDQHAVTGDSANSPEDIDKFLLVVDGIQYYQLRPTVFKVAVTIFTSNLYSKGGGPSGWKTVLPGNKPDANIQLDDYNGPDTLETTVPFIFSITHETTTTLPIKLINFCIEHHLRHNFCRFLIRLVLKIHQKERLKYNRWYHWNVEFLKKRMSYQVPFQQYARHEEAVAAEMDNMANFENVQLQDVIGTLVTVNDPFAPVANTTEGERKKEEALKALRDEERSKRIAQMYHIVDNLVMTELRSFIDDLYAEEVALTQAAKEAEEQVIREARQHGVKRRKRYDRKRRSIPLSRIVIVHSCLLPKQQDLRVLRILLNEMRRFGMMQAVSAVLVFHYGEPIPDTFLEEYPEILYVFVSRDTSFFETPTLRIMQWLAHHLINTHYPEAKVFVQGSDELIKGKRRYAPNPTINVPQILYLHTKGVSYADLYPQIEEWRNFAMYYMIERHETNYHMLKSGKYDVIGVTYHYWPRMFIGNYWSTRVDYLVNSPVNEIRFESVNKYSAEKLILRTPYVRIYMPTFYDAILLPHRYPRYCYASIDSQSKYMTAGDGPHWNKDESTRQQYSFLTETMLNPVPSYQEWLTQCTNLSISYYRQMHHLETPVYHLQSKRQREEFLCIGMDLSSRQLPSDEDFLSELLS